MVPLLALLITNIIRIYKFRQDRNDTEARHDDERFVKVASMLGSASVQEQMAGASSLRTFLSHKTDRFHPIVRELTTAMFRARPLPIENGEERGSRHFGYLDDDAKEGAFYQTVVPALVESIELISEKDASKNPARIDVTSLSIDRLHFLESDLSHADYS